MIKSFFPSLVVMMMISVTCFSQEKQVIFGHSHNDYHRNRPLFEAFEHGFKSIEVDVILSQGELYVAHEESEINKAHTLESLYLQPLMSEFLKRDSSLYENEPLIIMIDFKTEAVSTYEVLKNILTRYKCMLSQFSDSTKTTKAIDIIISGSRPIAQVQKDSTRLVAIDGRPNEIYSNANTLLFPMVSEDWFDFIKKYGSVSESVLKDNVKEYTSLAHKQGKLVRFWNTPNTEQQWQLMLDLGVDLINNDAPAKFAEFIRNVKP